MIEVAFMSQGEQSFKLILSRFDQIDKRLDNQDVVLTRVDKQTTITNGRVSMLEEVNRKKLNHHQDVVSSRKWWIETLIKLAPWVACMITLYIAIGVK